MAVGNIQGSMSELRRNGRAKQFFIITIRLITTTCRNIVYRRNFLRFHVFIMSYSAGSTGKRVRF
jgi:hypothetical protein